MLCLACGLGKQVFGSFTEKLIILHQTFTFRRNQQKQWGAGRGADNTPSDFHSPEELTEISKGLDNSFLSGMYTITLPHSIINISCMNQLLVFRSITEYRNCKQLSIRWDIITQQYFKVSVNELQTFKC
jgi:hypothetical protein